MSAARNQPGHTENPPGEIHCVNVYKQDLPLHCPLPSMTLWDSHPRVYLPLETTGRAQCPYCGTEYVLKD